MLAARLQREWLSGGPLSLALLPLSGVYRLLLALRRLLYALGIKRSAHLPVPVIVVGNWIVGGAGKTPTTLAVLQHLSARGLRAGVVSRGYGREGDEVRLVSAASSAREVGDEPLLLHLRGRVPVAVGRDRVAAAHALLEAHPELQLLLSDDGLQHWKLPRQLSLLVFDERGLGNGRLLPAGPLREPPRLPDGPALVVYNHHHPTTPLAGFTGTRQLAGAVPLAAWWAGERPSLEALQALRERPGLVAVAGIAQPQRFFGMLRELGIQAMECPQPDHANYHETPWPAGAAAVVLTEKDAVKLRPDAVGGTPVWVVALDFSPGAAFEAALDDQLQRLFSA